MPFQAASLRGRGVARLRTGGTTRTRLRKMFRNSKIALSHHARRRRPGSPIPWAMPGAGPPPRLLVRQPVAAGGPGSRPASAR